jgi:hypothetical protein
VTAPFAITQTHRSGWQRQAVAALSTILDEHGDLPAIAWLVGPVGSTLVGRTDRPGPAGQVRAVFGSWCRALGVGEPAETLSPGGVAHLRATVHAGRVQVVLVATVVGDDEWQA